MSWAIEEHVEDAIVAYLRATAEGDLRVYAAGTESEITLPALMVMCGDGSNVTDDGPITGRRQYSVTLEIRAEAAPLLDSSGVMLTTARERFRDLREQVSARLFDPSLHESLNRMIPHLVLFSMAHPTATTARAVDGRNYTASWTLDVIAQGVA